MFNQGQRNFCAGAFTGKFRKRRAGMRRSRQNSDRRPASPYFVKFDFQAQGIHIRGRRFPVVKMDWVEGETLGVHS